eukprot:TRINITY_DN1401_c0_g1_i1.p1 TRINITY_DN1401_c0_g1~~TRINITY_DN1401_c0_g1_i1.p1  ORF type:complete len:167 (+),score=43.28 TRINITY_DN1401_c0_g1_i1:60-503(+)
MAVPDCISIIFISLCSSMFTTFVEWLLVYRTEGYHRLKDKVDVETKKLEKMKEEDTFDEKSRRKIEKQEADLKELNTELQKFRMKATVIVLFSTIALFNLMSNVYDARIVAKLPFQPIGFVTGMSHRNLPGSDMTDCAYMFITFWLK